jgi:long-chain fatty acid transport protein
MRGWKTLPVLLVLLVLLFTASTSFAAGFRLPEAGAKAMGMGFAFTAQADDPSAIYFNPAGLTQLKGQNVMLGVTYARENGGEFTGTTPLTGGATVSETQTSLDFFIPNMYYTNTNASTGIAYGVGIFAPFGLGQEYNDRFTSIFRSAITKIDLQTVVVNPTIAFDVNEFLSLGAGIDFMWAKAKLARTSVINNSFPPANTPLNLYTLDLKGDGTAWGYNFGILLKPFTNFKVGFSYRSPFTLKIKDADADISNISSNTIAFPLGPIPAGAVPGTFPGVVKPASGAASGNSFSTKANTTLNLPATAALGIAYKLDRLTVEVDADWTFWHSWQRLDIDIRDQGALLADINSSREWKDVVAFRIGAEYRVTDPLALRVGFVYDPTPVPAATMDAFLPDADRLNYMIGAGYKIGKVTIDGALMYVDKKDRTVNNQASLPFPSYGSGFNGTWTGDAWLAGLDVTYNF